MLTTGPLLIFSRVNNMSPKQRLIHIISKYLTLAPHFSAPSFWRQVTSARSIFKIVVSQNIYLSSFLFCWNLEKTEVLYSLRISVPNITAIAAQPGQLYKPIIGGYVYMLVVYLATAMSVYFVFGEYSLPSTVTTFYQVYQTSLPSFEAKIPSSVI